MGDRTSQPPDGVGINPIYSGALFLWNGIASNKNQIGGATATNAGTDNAGADGQYHLFTSAGAMSWTIGAALGSAYTLVLASVHPTAMVSFAKLFSMPSNSVRIESQTTAGAVAHNLIHTGVAAAVNTFAEAVGGFDTEMWTYVARYGGGNLTQYLKRGDGTVVAGATEAISFSGGSTTVALGDDTPLASQGLYAALLLNNDVGDTEAKAIRDNVWRIFAPDVSVEQEGARFGNDDGNEAAHTFAAAQDANLTSPLATSVLLRTLLNMTGGPDTSAYELRSQKNGSGGYAKVPVGSSSSPTLSYGEAGTINVSGTGTVAPVYPSNITPQSGLVLVVAQKPATANGGGCTTPSGWTLQTSKTGANDGNTGGYTTTLGADTGNCNIFVYTKDTVDGSEGGSLSVTLTDSNVAWAQIFRLQSSDAATWSWAASVGKDTAAGNVSITTDAGIAIAAGDHVLAGMVIPTDVTTPSQFSAEALAQTGTTFGTVNEIGEPDSTTGNDIGGFLCEAHVSSGSGSVAPTLTATAGGTTTNVRGPGFVIRARLTAVTNEIFVAASANVAAGGEATTARLTAPSGKTTSDFVAGRRWDDENGTDTTNITADDYAELEWSINTQAPAANGDFYDFRVYVAGSPLTTYTVTPRLTLGSGGGTTQNLAGDAAAAASAAAQLAITKAMAGAAAAQGGAAGAMLLLKSLLGAAAAQASVVGDMALAHLLGATAAAQGIASGVLQNGGNIVTSPLKNNTGTVLAGETGVTMHVYDAVTGVKVVTKTGQATDGSGVMSVFDALLTAGVTYRVVIVLASGAEGMDRIVAT